MLPVDSCLTLGRSGLGRCPGPCIFLPRAGSRPQTPSSALLTPGPVHLSRRQCIIHLLELSSGNATLSGLKLKEFPFFPFSSRGCKFKIMVPAGSVPSKVSLLGLQMTPSHRVLTWSSIWAHTPGGCVSKFPLTRKPCSLDSAYPNSLILTGWIGSVWVQRVTGSLFWEDPVK